MLDSLAGVVEVLAQFVYSNMSLLTPYWIIFGAFAYVPAIASGNSI